MSAIRAGGRPPRYRSAEAMQRRIDAYFEACRGEVLRDAEGDPVLNRRGDAIMVGAEPPTVAGLADALGFADKSSIYDYRAKKRFEWTIQRALLRIERYAETRLFDRDGAAGARFSLQNNFKGWKDRVEVTEKKDDAGVAVLEEVRARMEREGSGES